MAVNQAVLNLAGQPEYASLTDTEAATAANALTVRKTNSTRWTYVDLYHAIDPSVVDQMAAALVAAGKLAAHGSLASKGLDFSQDSFQSTVDDLVANNVVPAQFGASLKAMGVWHISPYAEKNGVGTATAEDFAIARKYMTLRNHLRVKYNAAVDAIEAGTVADLAALKAMLGA